MIIFFAQPDRQPPDSHLHNGAPPLSFSPRPLRTPPPPLPAHPSAHSLCAAALLSRLPRARSQASSSARAAAGTAAASLPALREGPLDALRDGGATSFRETALALHPVEAVQAQQLANEWDTSLRLAAMAHGQAAAMQRRLDRAALSQIRRLPGAAPSSHALLDAYLGRDGKVGVEDVLNVPELRALAASADLSDPK